MLLHYCIMSSACCLTLVCRLFLALAACEAADAHIALVVSTAAVLGQQQALLQRLQAQTAAAAAAETCFAACQHYGIAACIAATKALEYRGLSCHQRNL
jgi:hypothetical protein